MFGAGVDGRVCPFGAVVSAPVRDLRRSPKRCARERKRQPRLTATITSSIRR
jgi:hypothetical protein